MKKKKKVTLVSQPGLLFPISAREIVGEYVGASNRSSLWRLTETRGAFLLFVLHLPAQLLPRGVQTLDRATKGTVAVSSSSARLSLASWAKCKVFDCQDTHERRKLVLPCKGWPAIIGGTPLQGMNQWARDLRQ